MTTSWPMSYDVMGGVQKEAGTVRVPLSALGYAGVTQEMYEKDPFRCEVCYRLHSRFERRTVTVFKREVEICPICDLWMRKIDKFVDRQEERDGSPKELKEKIYRLEAEVSRLRGMLDGEIDARLDARYKRREEMEKQSVVYFISDGDLVKIGVSSCVKSRVKHLQTSTGKKLKVLATTPGNHRNEKALHKKFGHLRVSGEWFKMSDELAEFVGGLKCSREGEQSQPVSGL